MKNRIIAGIALAVLGVTTLGCSVLDSEDRRDLEAGIDKESPDTRHAMAMAAMTAKTRGFLDGRPPNQRVMGVECKQRLPPGSWFAPRAEQDLVVLVSEVSECMATGETYQGCIATLAAALVIKASDRWAAKIATSIPGSLDSQLENSCREVVDPDFLPANVPGANEDLNRVSAGEIVDWLLSLHAPPPGFGPDAWAPLVPFICALGASWGCPGDPQNPLDTTITQSGTAGGGG